MRIKKKIFAMLMMLCMVLQMLPNTVLAETISGEGNTYIGPTRICPNSNLEFYFTTDNVGPDGRDAWIGRIDKIDETFVVKVILGLRSYLKMEYKRHILRALLFQFVFLVIRCQH